MYLHSIYQIVLESFFFLKVEYRYNYNVSILPSNLHAGMCEKNKLRVYRELKEVFECKKYLYGVPDMGSKLLFRFRSGTHGLNEELGRHITRNNY